MWERSGTLADVVGGLLHLPPPHDPQAPRLIVSTAPPAPCTEQRDRTEPGPFRGGRPAMNGPGWPPEILGM
ncbi:hypothetical protein [Gandjariella thermophila]|uniref:hypothetical protein n=1 Tax=Gandjariella thermophila TaxID=1931992 RepID=UPI0010F5CD19|nr:hypothetical protein [Gandjariella thermophila]